VIQSYDYDWISAIDNMNYVLCDWGSLEPVQKCQKPVALCYSYGTWRRGTSRQAVRTQNSGNGHWNRVGPGERGGSARRN